MYTSVNLATGHSRALSTTAMEQRDEGPGFLQERFESFIIKILIYSEATLERRTQSLATITPQSHLALKGRPTGMAVPERTVGCVQ